MKLRPLKKNDAIPMLEWMQDPNINSFFRFSPDNVSIESCESFIENSFTKENRHYAIEENGEYQGTISLKHIDYHNKTAEYAIALHQKSRGKGLGTKASKQILMIAFEELALNKVYLDVFSDNAPAIHLYQKLGFRKEGELRKHIVVKKIPKNLTLFGMLKEDYEKIQSH